MCLQGTCPPPFRESISWIISPFKFWTATIFLHAHLQVVYYKCVKFHKNPISRLGGVALTRYMDGQGDSYIPPPNFVCGGYNKLIYLTLCRFSFEIKESSLSDIGCLIMAWRCTRSSLPDYFVMTSYHWNARENASK